MKVSALIIMTKLSRPDGVIESALDAGSVTVGQRMIAAFQSAGTELVLIVADRKDEKAMRQFSQQGVLFLFQDGGTYSDSVCLGLNYLKEKYESVLLAPGNRPLICPETIRMLADSGAYAAVPCYGGRAGYPVFLNKDAVEAVLAAGGADIESMTESVSTQIEHIDVNDEGVVLRAGSCRNKKALMEKQSLQMTRPVVQVSLLDTKTAYDERLGTLLHLIDETGSVRDACSLMQISYSTAWNALNAADNSLGYPLLERLRGGKCGSRSVLTDKGRKLMQAYDRFLTAVQKDTVSLYDSLMSGDSGLI